MEQRIRELENSQNRLVALLESVLEDQDWGPGPEEWSFRYIAAHLATVERECHLQRVKRIAAGEQPYFESYFNTGWDFSRYDMKESLDEWVAARREIIEFVRALSEDERSLTGTHSAFGRITLLDVLEMMLEHDREHLRDLERMMGAHDSSEIPS